MCGIAGIARREPRGVTAETLLPMAAALHHRGPDGARVLPGKRVGLAHTRLSIIDLEGGTQPMSTVEGRYTIVYNGEVYNYLELRLQLEDRGHSFRTRSDTEVVVTAFAEWGEGALDRFNGQFAFAIHDKLDDSVFFGRDRFGVRPLFYSIAGDSLVFGSEVKALFASGEVEARPDLVGLDEVLTYWAARAPRTVFDGVSALPPGWCAWWRAGRLTTRPWFRPAYAEVAAEGRSLVDEIDELLNQSVSYRMRSDVTVGAYLSGGLDSSVTSSLAAQMTPLGLRSFSIVFEDPQFNESQYQLEVADALGTVHHIRAIKAGDIAAVFPQVIRHAETPLLRSAPAPMMLLAEQTRANGIKVVLTGEGADELFLGYDLFREAAVRRFCLRGGSSPWRARLFDRLYPYMANARGDLWQKWFLAAGDISDPLFSHMPRFMLAARTKDFYATSVRGELQGVDPLARLRASLPSEFASWSAPNRAAYLEITTLLEPYLLSSQGDRMSLAHGVEGRYPFLDHRLFAWTAALPVTEKLRGLRDKRVLRQWAARHIPQAVANRAKQPYRAPDAPAFFAQDRPAYVDALLSPASISESGYFDAAAVSGLVRRCRAARVVSARENQALLAVLSTQLWHHTFFTSAGRDAAGAFHQRNTQQVVLT